MSKRDYVAEILSKNARLYPRSKRWDKIAPHLRQLDDAVDVLLLVEDEGSFLLEQIYERDKSRTIIDIDSGLLELNRYIAVRCVACMEGYFRLVVADMINFGEPYRSNASKFSQISFSIETALSLQKNSLTIGDFVAHLISLNNIHDIIGSLSKLLDTDFMEMFKRKRLELPMQQTLFEIDTFAELMQYIENMFRNRHIFCHEIAIHSEDQEFSPRTYLSKTTEFLWISENIIGELLKS